MFLTILDKEIFIYQFLFLEFISHKIFIEMVFMQYYFLNFLEKEEKGSNIARMLLTAIRNLELI